MRKISAGQISSAVSSLCQRANFQLRKDVYAALERARGKERNARAKNMLDEIISNADIACAEKIALCQDTGLPVVFVGIGQDVSVQGDIKKAINKGIEDGYRKGFLRNSIIADPLDRKKPGYSPCVIHFDVLGANKLHITVLPKGFGSENKSRIRMFEPTASIEEIKKFIVSSVRDAGPDACPPYIVGVGIGGTADYAMLLAKKALLRDIAQRSAHSVQRLEKELAKEINELNIGPMGLGGDTTCLGVNIETFPTHIAGLPVAVNISCHALRSASTVI